MGSLRAVGTQVTNDVNSLAIGTTYADVARRAPEAVHVGPVGRGNGGDGSSFSRGGNALLAKTSDLQPPVKADNGGPCSQARWSHYGLPQKSPHHTVVTYPCLCSAI